MIAGKKSPALLIGFGEAKPGMGGSAGDDGGEGSPGAMAGVAFAKALKSGDGQAIYDAFESLFHECKHASESAAEQDADGDVD